MKASTSLVIVLTAMTLVLAACGSPATSGSPAASASPVNTPAPMLGNNLVNKLAAVTQSGNFHDPLDSIPTMDATTIYFTASGPHGPGVFRVPAAGGTATEVFAGQPFVTPRGISISTDDQHLYIADPGAGELFELASGGGAPVPLRGSEKTVPQNLDAVTQDGKQVLYFSGRNPGSGQPALLKIPSDGADEPTVIVEGSPLVAPDGVVVTHTGSIYLSDQKAAGGGSGSVFKIEGSKVTVIVKQVRTGNPAGIALAADESILLVSALQLDRPSDMVLLVNLRTGETGSITAVIEKNQHGGGLHSSHHAVIQASSALPPAMLLVQSVFLRRGFEPQPIYAWADLSAGGAGTVYRVELK